MVETAIIRGIRLPIQKVEVQAHPSRLDFSILSRSQLSELLERLNSEGSFRSVKRLEMLEDASFRKIQLDKKRARIIKERDDFIDAKTGLQRIFRKHLANVKFIGRLSTTDGERERIKAILEKLEVY